MSPAYTRPFRVPRSAPLAALIAGVGLAACGSGTVTIGDGPSRRCPAIRADDSAPVVFADALIGEANPAVFTVTNDCLADRGDLELTLTSTSDAFQPVESTVVIAPGESADVALEYTPTGYDPVEATLTIATNDDDIPTVAVQLQGASSPDQDGDGSEAVEVGGPDCDDFDSAIGPGREELWYDGIDSDCSGGSDFDQDGDGVDRNPEGGDCDDLDPTVLPGAEELVDVLDNDCDGWVDEDALRPGDLLVTEIMADPVAVFDTSGEWFEVTNKTDRTLNLRNWQFTDFAGDEFVVAGDLVINPGGRLTLAIEEDYFLNGGVEPNYVYPRSGFDLGNTTDTIAAVVDGNVVALVEYDVRWALDAGAAMQLDPFFETTSAASIGTYWCSAIDELNGGDRGTPGSANAYCTSVDHDGDGFSVDDGDCDDEDPTSYPSAREQWNGVDNDCDGLVDNATIQDVEAGYVDGDRSNALGWSEAMSAGDVDDDGDLELLLGTPRGNGYSSGVVYTLDAGDAGTWADQVYDVDEAKIEPLHTNNYMAMMSSTQADNDGDGKVDLVIGGSSGYVVTSSDPSVLLFTDGAELSGSLDSDDADASYTGGVLGYGYSRLLSDVDMDGDGVAEILVGAPYASGPDGRAYFGAVYLIDADGAAGVASLTEGSEFRLHSASYYSFLGSNIAGGDLDGDGYDELVACARWGDLGGANAGECFIVAGDTSRLESDDISSAAEATITGRSANEQFGLGQIAIGDFDDDGFDDLALGHPLRDEVLIYLDVGSMSGSYDTSDADLEASTSSSPSFFGMGVAAGDLDGDGIDDLAVGAPDTQNLWGADEAGAIYVWTGDTLSKATKDVDETDMWGAATGYTVGDALGASILAADLEDDGVDDLVVSAPGYSTQAGRVSIILLD